MRRLQSPKFMGTNSNKAPTPWISYTNRKKATTFCTQAPTCVIHFNGERLQPLTSISTNWDRSSNFSYFSTDWWRFQSSWKKIPLLHSAKNDDVMKTFVSMSSLVSSQLFTTLPPMFLSYHCHSQVTFFCIFSNSVSAIICICLAVT